MKLRQRLQKFMYGRYGIDRFGTVLLWTSLTLMLINSFANSLVLYALDIFLLGYYFFRVFSRNINKRFAENEKFEKILKKCSSFFKLRRAMWRDRKTHVYTKCPRCSINIRLPRKIGKHQVNCPKCNTIFNFECKK